jgi:phosphatidylglycerophosphate synthase
MPEQKPHTRVNDILLGPLERPALQWLAAHQPAWMTPDLLTAIGTVGAFMIFVGYVLCNRSPAFLWLANLGLVVNWYGDSLDGTLARYRKIERPRYGFFVDHTVDAFNTMLILLGLGLSPYARFDLAALALIAYLMMSVLVYVRTYVQGVFKISYGKIGPTELRVVILLANTFIFFFGNPQIHLPFVTLSLVDLLVILIAVGLLVVYVVTALQEARALAHEEGKPAGNA